MNAEETKINKLISFTEHLLQISQEQKLTDIHRVLLEQALEGRKLKDIQIVGYSTSTVERVFAPRLWALLSKATQQKIGVKNVRLTLERLLCQSEWGAAELDRKKTEGSTEKVDTDNFNPSLVKNPESGSVRLSTKIIENLPAPTSTTFVGRETEVKKILELLSPEHSAHLISIDGIGGVGKTTLALECARRCLAASRQSKTTLDTPAFDAFIFVSAKLHYLESFGLLARLDPTRTLQDILSQIAEVLEDADLVGSSLTDQIKSLRRTIQKRRILLIVDNLETVEDQQSVLSFLHDLPASVKVMITTREQIVFVPVRLAALSETEALEMIQHEEREKAVLLDSGERSALFEATGGVPVAIRYAIGQLANGYTLAGVLKAIGQPTGDISRFCFENAVQGFRGQAAHHLLMALALFPSSANRDALFQTAFEDSADLELLQDSLVQLCRLSLVIQNGNRYTMLPLTQEYALAELKAHPRFSMDARHRWVAWAIKYSEVYAGQEVKTWHIPFDGLQEEWQNIRAIADYCVSKGWYVDMLQLWQNVELYTYSMGRRKGRKDYWSDRLCWTEWMMNHAIQEGDWRAASRLMLDHAWTLVAIRKPQPLEKAETLFDRLHEFRQYQDLPLQVEWIKKMAVLQIQQQKFEEAHSSLDDAESLLSSIDWVPQNQCQQKIQLQYYRGMNYFNAGQIVTAKQSFENARTLALSVGWERAVRMAENWLADIAVLQGDLDWAEQVLVKGLSAAELQDDPTRIAYVKRSFAGLVQARGDTLEAERWGLEALGIFEHLGMPYEAEETKSFLENLVSPKTAES